MIRKLFFKLIYPVFRIFINSFVNLINPLDMNIKIINMKFFWDFHDNFYFYYFQEKEFLFIQLINYLIKIFFSKKILFKIFFVEIESFSHFSKLILNYCNILINLDHVFINIENIYTNKIN